MRYLGGGIGHLEQFPPAHNKDKDAAAHDNNTIEVETDDFIVGSDDEGEEDYESEEDAGDDEEDDGNEAEGAGEDEDALDEETGNVY